MEIGKNIKKYRKLRGMSQKELASSIGKKHYKSIAKYESGETSISVDTLEDISKALDVHIINLLGLEKEHKSIFKPTVDIKVDTSELEEFKENLEKTRAMINEVNNKEIKIDVWSEIRRNKPELLKESDIRIIDIERAHRIIEARKPTGKFMTINNSMIVAIDNTSGDAWTEDFNNFLVAYKWITGEIDTEEAYRLDEEVINE